MYVAVSTKFRGIPFLQQLQSDKVMAQIECTIEGSTGPQGFGESFLGTWPCAEEWIYWIYIERLSCVGDTVWDQTVVVSALEVL